MEQTSGNGRLDTSHGRLAIREDGPDGGIPLILLQRFSGTVDDWDPALIKAISADRRAICLDSAGIGRSEGRMPETIAGMAAAAAEVIGRLGFKHADVLGWSLGGVVAQQLARDAPHLLTGIAMWTYLNMPFLLASPGVISRPAGEWRENGETWQRLDVTFPPGIATHSTLQTLYIDDVGLLKRHDYNVEIAGNTPGAHYVDGYVEAQGLLFPTARRIYPRQPDGSSLAEPLVVSIDLSDIRLG
ncbi:alpha/beta fold hydrolase [Methylocella silvestris]|uniref:alpha/beta fold hydrolase n=1 Tax=Methylocella silvestris TaxID=199596 RepID=UPI0011AEF308|nr:alpha/beta fold hydrolase [Methylocella silvestris]